MLPLGWPYFINVVSELPRYVSWWGKKRERTKGGRVGKEAGRERVRDEIVSFFMTKPGNSVSFTK